MATWQRVEEAERSYRDAAESGDTQAMNNLAALLHGVGRVDEADQWFRRAA